MSVTQSSLTSLSAPVQSHSTSILPNLLLKRLWCQSATRLVSSLTAARPLHEPMAFNSTICWLETIAVAMIVVWNPIQPQPYSFSFSRPTTRTIVANSSRLHSLVVSTAECERSFSIMNDICTDNRSSIGIRRTGVLMFAKLMGPIHFSPELYAQKWIDSGRHSADDTTSRTREMNAVPADSYSHISHLFE